MKFATLLAVASALVSSVAANSCTYANGYYYCNPTSKFIYKNAGTSGSYRDVTSMNEKNQDVSYTTTSYSGVMAPFDEELSVHVRGPINLQEFAVYYPSSSGSANQKRDDADAAAESADCSTTQHLRHQHVKRATQVVTQTRYVDQNGNPITDSGTAAATATVVEYSAPVPAANSPLSNTVAPSPATTATGTTGATSKTSTSSTSPTSSTSTAASTASASAGDWVRSSHYVPGQTSNLTVLNNFGGSGSGVWSGTWGLSLSYANADNTGGASSATPLKDVTLNSINEFSLWSGLACGDKSEQYGCGYSRPGSVALHAFAGAEKIMVFSFKMPSDFSTGSQTGTDMPAIWLLNAKIPRIGQYLDISCWNSGCGELDLFEVLVNDYTKMVTALHGKQANGSGDYINRPSDAVMKAVVIFYAGEIHVQVVDSSFQFGSTLSASQVAGWRAVSGSVISLA